VFVVYNPAASDWLIRLAKQSAHEQGLELVGYEVPNLRGAVQSYQKIFSAANSQSDALWLPQDPTTVEDSSILPLVLQESWNQNIAVFSSNFSYVRRGVLLSLFPDNLALGKSLGTLAQGILSSGGYRQRGMMPLRDVQSAINLRTAKHLGINPKLLQGFNMTFPEQ
jgi:putative ABC transport system substrate-binding protein